MATTDDPWVPWLASGIANLDERRQLRDLIPLDPAGGIEARCAGRSYLLFSTNDYLGLSVHPAVRSAAAQAAERHGLGPRASALVCGYTEHHEALEAELARLEGTESALLFPTGYAANVGTLSALAAADLAIFSDALNHASIIDGCRLAARAGAQVSVYRHADANHLEALLRECDRPRRLIVSDSLFSMDGTLAPLADLVQLRDRYGAWLMLDEAHATLVFGARGAGVAEAQGLEDRVDIHLGTLSKAIGSQGGFVAGRRDLRRWLINRGRSQVFSTALPLPVVAAAMESLAVRRREPERVTVLWKLIQRFAGALEIPATSPILPIVVGDEGAALALAESLRDVGLWVPAIRPPTVPMGTSRLRVTLSSLHSVEAVDRLAATIGSSRPRGVAAGALSG